MVFLAKGTTFREFTEQIQEGGHRYEADKFIVDNRRFLVHWAFHRGHTCRIGRYARDMEIHWQYGNEPAARCDGTVVGRKNSCGRGN